MERNGIKLTEQHVRWAALGGAILGGGGGGSAVTGAETGELAVRFSPLELTPLDQIDPETVIVTASMVGAPAAQEKFVSPADMMRCVELFIKSTGIRPGGIITNENGGGSPVRRSAFDRMRRGKGRKGGFRGSGICAHLR